MKELHERSVDDHDHPHCWCHHFIYHYFDVIHLNEASFIIWILGKFKRQVIVVCAVFFQFILYTLFGCGFVHGCLYSNLQVFIQNTFYRFVSSHIANFTERLCRTVIIFIVNFQTFSAIGKWTFYLPMPSGATPVTIIKVLLSIFEVGFSCWIL